MSVLSRLIVAGAVLVAATSLTYAGSLERTTLDPMDHNAAQLTVVGPEATMTYSPADLEATASCAGGALGLGPGAVETYRMVTHTPWREAPAAFDGVLLRDLLIANGMEDISELRIVAENDFAITMPREVWESIPILVATRVDGQTNPKGRPAYGRSHPPRKGPDSVCDAYGPV